MFLILALGAGVLVWNATRQAGDPVAPQISTSLHDSPSGASTALHMDALGLGEVQGTSNRIEIPETQLEIDSPKALPVIEHPWASIGGLAIPDAYPSLEEIVASSSFNPRRVKLDEAQFERLGDLLSQLRYRLESKRGESLLRLSDSVSWKVDIGQVEPAGTLQGHPELGCAHVSRSTREGLQLDVIVRPGEFAGLDIACEDARIEALAGERLLQEFFAALD